MQKLPEVSNRKKGWRMCKEKGTSQQKKEAHFSFSSDQQSDNTLLTGGGHYVFVFGWCVG